LDRIGGGAVPRRLAAPCGSAQRNSSAPARSSTDSIEVHLTIILAAVAIGCSLQDQTGVSIKKVFRTLHPRRTVAIDIAGHTGTTEPTITPEAYERLSALGSR
jgi:metal-sulfur cluster biosynthetic enzyme